MQHLVLFLVIKIFIVIKCNATILGKVFGAGSSKTGQGKKSLLFTFAWFLTAIAEV